MTIDSMLRLDLVERDGALIRKLLKTLTYSNPKFHEAKRLGFSTHGITPEIQNYTLSADGERLTTTRGEIRKVRAIFPDEPIDDFNGARTTYIHNIQYENHDFKLDERQDRAIAAIKRKKQGIIHAATSAGKSAIIMAAIAARNVPTLVVVHRKVLLEQLLEDAKKWLKGCSIGQLGGGKHVLGDVVFAIDKSLGMALERDATVWSKFQCVIQDECHLSPCSTFQKIMNKLPAPYRYGMTGTLKRKDGMEFMIHATYGEVIAEITKDELLEANRVSPVEVNIITSDAEVDAAFFDLPTTKKFQAIDKALHANAYRDDLALEATQEILKNPNARVVILSRYVEPTERLARKLHEHYGIDASIVNGQHDDAKITCKEFERGEVRVLCATIGCFATGVNIPNLTDIVLISPVFNNELLIHQTRGRLMRRAEGKTHGTLHFIWDQFVFEEFKLKKFLQIMKK